MRDIFKQFDIELSDQQENKLKEYYKILVEENKKMNLTSITEYEDVVWKHFLDSALIMKDSLWNGRHKVFDVGTGSGILAIAAAKLGAKTVKAVDIDATAVRVAIENIAGNELTEKISVQQGDLLHGTEGKADIIIANIIADIIIMLLQDIPGKLKSGGIFLASGIIEERQNDVSAAASKVGLCVEAVDAKGGWVVMQMRKED